jgi:hypothetical protein
LQAGHGDLCLPVDLDGLADQFASDRRFLGPGRVQNDRRTGRRHLGRWIALGSISLRSAAASCNSVVVWGDDLLGLGLTEAVRPAGICGGAAARG